MDRLKDNTPVAYNIQDKNTYSNRGGNNPSYVYKNSRIIWLNSAYNTTQVNNGTTYYEFGFDIPQFQLFNRTKLSVVSYISNEASAKPIIIKLKNTLYDTNSTYNTDKEAYPTLLINHTNVASQVPNTQFQLILLPQLINNITITLSDSFTVRNNGFTISGGGAGHFVLGLLFEDLDLVLDNAVSMYN